MHTGLFFGSFNPIHHGHLAIAGYFVEYGALDALWFVVSPQNPLKSNKSLLHEQYRLDMVDKAIEDDNRFSSCDIEFRMPRPSYTIDTLVRLQEQYPDYTFSLIMGSDTLETLPRWKNYEQILKNHRILVYPRHDSPASEWMEHPSVKLVKAPRMEISARFIRESLQNGKNIRYFVPDAVLEYIDQWGFFINK